MMGKRDNRTVSELQHRKREIGPSLGRGSRHGQHLASSELLALILLGARGRSTSVLKLLARHLTEKARPS